MTKLFKILNRVTAFDQHSGLLYVSIRQTFRVWFVPLYKAPVRLVSVLQLRQQASWATEEAPSYAAVTAGEDPSARANLGQAKSRYYIASQEDLYPANDCFQFMMPGLGPFVWFLWQLYSTGLCLLGSLVFLPLYLLMNKGAVKKTA